MPSEYSGHLKTQTKKQTKLLRWEKGYRIFLALNTAFRGMGGYTGGRK